MKISIGTGKDKLNDYLNIDIDEFHKPDLVADFRDLDFMNLDEIRAHHLLEHFDRFEVITILEQWHSWLKKGGGLVLELPDFEGICKEFKKGNKYWLSRHAFGSHKEDWAYHREGWWEEKVNEILPSVGFRIINIEKIKRLYPIICGAVDNTVSEKFKTPNGEVELELPVLMVHAYKE